MPQTPAARATAVTYQVASGQAVVCGTAAPPPPPPPPPAPSITLSSTGNPVAGTQYSVTVTAANLTGALVVTPANVSGTATFNPSTATPAPGELVKLFGATWAAAGAASIRATAPGGVVSNTLNVTVAAAPSPSPAPLDLLLGTATPEQIGVRATWNTTRTAGTLVRLQYKLPASGTWTDGPFLSEFLASEVLEIGPSSPGSGGTGAESGLSVADGFGGFAYHLAPGTTYDVRLAVLVPAAATAYTASQSYTTRALPAALPAANKTCTPATLTASLAGLVAGDHLQLQAGTYPPFTVSASGTSGSPIYLSCAAGASVVYATADKIITVNGSHLVFDAMTITGTGVDSERAFMLAGGSVAGVYSTAFYSASVATQRVTVRNSTITGVDIGFKLWAQSDQWLIYNNTITGNNLHDVQYTIPPGDTYPRSGWNDTAINWHGLGNCAWNNTIQGFGDTVKFGFSTAPNGFECRWNHFYRNKVLRGADDGVEFDNSASGSSYRNYFANVGTLASFDGAFEGPFDVFENVCVNAGYGPLKMNGGSANARFFHNTFVLTVKHGTDHGLLTSNVANHYRVKFQNNVVVYRGAGNMVHWSAPLQSGPLFDHNAWYSATDDFFITSPIYGSAGSLAAAKTTFAPFLAGDVNTTTNPFAATITLGANAQSEYTAGVFDVTLTGGASPLNAGVAVAGFNDGFTGGAPTMGAVWGGQGAFFVGQGDPPVSSSGGAWTPNRAAGGEVLLSDFPQLPANTWVTVAGSLNKLTDIQPPTSYPNSGGSNGFPGITRAWGGAGWDSSNLRMLINGGGHGDSSSAETGVYGVNAKTMQVETIVARTDYANRATISSGTTLVQGEGFPPGTNYPTLDGRPGSQHTYYGLVWLSASVMSGLGLGSPTNGGLFIPGSARAVVNLDSGAYTKVWWKTSAPDNSYQTFVRYGNRLIWPRNSFQFQRWDMSLTETTDWATSGQDPAPGVPSFGQALSVTTSSGNFIYNNRTFCDLAERGEMISFASSHQRVRYGAAETAAASDWTSYQDTLTLSGADAGDLNTAGNYTDSGTNLLNGAGASYLHSSGEVFVFPNTSGNQVYRITGLASGATGTVTKLGAGSALLTTSTNGTFGRARVFEHAGCKLALRVSDTANPIEVMRIV